MLISQLVRFSTIKENIYSLKGDLLDDTCVRFVYTKFLGAMSDPEQELF